MLIRINSSSPVLVMISSISMPICNCFRFLGVFVFDALVRGKFPYPAAHNFVTKNKLLVAAHSEDFVILAGVVLT